MAGYRKEKLEELIKRIIADTLLSEIKDPRIGFVTVTRVKLSKDYSNSDVWISIIGNEKEKKLTMDGLESARGFLQHVVGKNIKLRSIPRIRFHQDVSIEEGGNMVDLLNKLEKSEE